MHAHLALMLSQRTRYTIRALLHLADRHGEGPVQLAEIAASQNIPPKFLTVMMSCAVGTMPCGQACSHAEIEWEASRVASLQYPVSPNCTVGCQDVMDI